MGILGLLAGFIAGKIVNKRGAGFFLDIVLGIAGALVGGVIFSRIFGWSGITGLNLWSLFVAVIGSVIVVFSLRAVLESNAGRAYI